MTTGVLVDQMTKCLYKNWSHSQNEKNTQKLKFLFNELLNEAFGRSVYNFARRKVEEFAELYFKKHLAFL